MGHTASTDSMRYPVWSAAVGHNGDLAIGAYRGGSLVFDSATGQERWSPRGDDGHNAVVSAMTYAADGQLLLTAGEDFELKVWAAANGQLLHTERLHKRPRSIAVSPTGLIVIGTWGDLGKQFPDDAPAPIYLYQLDQNQHDSAIGVQAAGLTEFGQLDGAIGTVRKVAFTPDGELLAASSEDDVLCVWNVESKQIVKEFAGHGGPVMCVAWAPDGKLLCGVGGVFDGKWQMGTAIVWDVETGEQNLIVRHPTVCQAVQYASNGRLITAGLDGRMEVWNAATGELLEEINAHSDLIRQIDVFPSGNLVASVGEDGAARIWDISKTSPRGNLIDPTCMEFIDLAYSPDSTQLASASADKAIRTWDVKRGELVASLGSHKHWANAVAYSPDGRLLASMASQFPIDPETKSELKLWDTFGNRLLGTYLLDVPYGRSMEFAPSGEHLVIGATFEKLVGRILLWNVTQRAVEKTLDVRGGFRTVVSRDGTLIGTTGGVWRYPSLEPVQIWDAGGYAFDIHPANKMVAIAEASKEEITLRSIDDGSILRTLAGHRDIVLGLHFSPDGKRLTSAGISGVVIVWNLVTGNEILRYRDHDFWAWWGKFAPDGRSLASCQGGRSMQPSIHLRRAASEEDARRLLTKGGP